MMPSAQTAAEIEAIVRARAEGAGLNPNHVWRDVKRRTETGRLVLHLLGLPDEWIKPSPGRRADDENHANRASRVDTLLLQAEASDSPISRSEAFRLVGAEFGVSAAAVKISVKRNADRNRLYRAHQFFEVVGVSR